MSNDLISRSVAIDEFYRRIGPDLTMDCFKYIEKVLNEVHTAFRVDSLLDRFGEIIMRYRAIGTPDELQEAMRIARYHGDSGWTPCSVGLPEEPGSGLQEMEGLDEYIVMIQGADIPTALYYAGNGKWCDAVKQDFYPVTAWRPFPGPYRPKRHVGSDFRQQIRDRFLKVE